jgi:aspartyl protease family protein
VSHVLPHALPPAAAIFVAVVLVLLVLRIRFVRAAASMALTAGLLTLFVVMLAQRAPYDPLLSRIAGRLAPETQQVVGRELRIPMASDGHFWAHARIDGIERRMLIDSGATVTALSAATARAAGLSPETGIAPVVLQTANGTIAAKTASIGTLRLGDIAARDLPVVVSPAFGDMDVLGMNFLSRLQSWRVEGGTLILVPHHPQAARPTA